MITPTAGMLFNTASRWIRGSFSHWPQVVEVIEAAGGGQLWPMRCLLGGCRLPLEDWDVRGDVALAQ
jgi:hypothetical protein